MPDPRKIYFDEARSADADGILTLDDVRKIHAVLNLLGVPSSPAPAKGRQINQDGLDLIKYFEGCRLKAYLDVAGVPTIGWGHTGPDVFLGQRITQAKADRLLDEDLDRFEAAVEKLTGGVATDNQFAALVSFAYNVGEGDGGLRTSTLLRKHNEGDYEGAAKQFARWNKARVDGVLRPVRGLTRRREAEAKLYRGEL